MVFTVQAIPSVSMTLADRAMIVDLTIKAWSGATQDKKVAADVAAANDADQDMGTYHKRLWSKEALDNVKRAQGAARTEHYARTLPWLNNGGRIISSAGYTDYAAAMRKHETAIDAAVSALLDDYDAHMAEARRRLGKLFNASDYPTKDQLRDKFSFGFNVLPVPTAADFRVQLGDLETERIRNGIEAATRAALDTALLDVRERVTEAVQHMADRLRAFHVNADGKTENVFRDSLVANVKELVDLIPSLNLTGDQALASLADRMRAELLTYSAGTLRVNQRAREETAAAAEKIIAEMADYM